MKDNTWLLVLVAVGIGVYLWTKSPEMHEINL